nr:MAG TPA: hypothetical protein [Caudoviricetes sp.]
MALSDKKILQSERNAVYVKSNQGRRLTGTVEQNKDAFDKFPQLLMDKYNALIDLLTSLGLDGIATDLESRYTKTETDTKISTETNDLIETIEYTKADGKFKIITKGGTVTTIDTDLEKIPASFELIEVDGKTYLRITNQDGTYTQTDVTSLLNVYTFSDSDTIDFTESPEYAVTATIKKNSITLDHLSLAAVSTLEGYVSAAAGSATAAAGSATAAETSANNASAFNQSAKGYSESASASKDAAASSATSAGNAATTANQKATAANNSAILAQSYAKGGTGTREGEDADNAKYYMEQAKAASGGDYITKVSPATAGNIPTLTADGQLVDSGKKAEDMGGAFIITYDRTTNTADKTYAEIKSAHEAGKQVQLIYHNIVFDYIGITDDASLWFAGSAPLKNSPVIITNQYVLMSVNSSNVWQAYIQSLVPVADTEGNILMAKNILGGKIWESVTPPFLNTVSSTTENHIPAFDENGQLVDSGKAASDFVPTPTTITGTLTAGSTSLVLSNAAITTDSTIDIYTDKWGVNPTDVTVVTGKLTLTFDAQDSALGVKVEVR